MRTSAVSALAVLAAAGMSQAQVINEWVANHTGSDTNEFVEFLGQPNTDYSNLWIVEIEGDSGQTGLVDDGIFNVGTTDGAGLWWSGFNNNVVENGTVTLLLVRDFTGAVGSDIDADDDGVIDATFWSVILDSIAIADGGAGDLGYSSVVLDSTLMGGSGFSPGGASRIPNGLDTDSVGDWTRNDFNGAGMVGFDPVPDDGTAFNTPGLPNVIPAPGAAALMGLGGLLMVRRRR